MPLPTMSLRVAPEYHQLIRDIATALRNRPELADVLRDVLQTQHVMHDVSQSQHSIALRDTDVLQSILDPILDRIGALEEREPRMVKMEALELRVAALEEWATSTQAASLDSGNEPRPPRPVAAGKPSGGSGKRRPPRSWTDADDAQLRRIFDQGGTQADACRALDRPSSVISPKWWKLAEANPAKAEATEPPAEPTGHVDEPPEPPED
jgi:hypothetical protein